MAIFTILYSNYYPGKIAKGVNKINFTMLYGDYCYTIIGNIPQKFSPCRKNNCLRKKFKKKQLTCIHHNRRYTEFLDKLHKEHRAWISSCWVISSTCTFWRDDRAPWALWTSINPLRNKLIKISINTSPILLSYFIRNTIILVCVYLS